jgi:cobalt/nickel transport system permease protein
MDHVQAGAGMTRFIERTIAGLTGTMSYVLSAEESATSGGLLQGIDPRVKVIGILALILSSALARRIWVIVSVLAIGLMLAIASRMELGKLARWIWGPALLFTGCIALPAIFITPGRSVWTVPTLGWTVTEQGLRSAAYLLSRAEAATTLTTLLVLTTPWTHVLKALRVFRLPVVFVVILGMTHRYLFLLMQSAFDMFESRKSRTVGVLHSADRRRLAASTVGVLLSKTFHLSADIHLAMQSRGYRGEVYSLNDFHARPSDWCWLFVFLSVSILAWRLGQ